MLDTLEIDDQQGPLLLRYLTRLFIAEVEVSEDPLTLLDIGIEKMMYLEVLEDSRTASTRDFLIRILEKEKRRYEEMVYRDVVNSFEDGGSALD